MMLGDAYVDVNNNSGKARLDIYHTARNLDLLEKKASILEEVTGLSTRIIEKKDERPLKGGRVREGFRLQTNFSRYLYNLHQTPFKFKAKQVVKPRALAILWQDDGSISINSRGYFSTATIATDSLEYWMVCEIRKQWNKLYGWCPALQDYNCRGKTYPRLRLVKSHTELLSEIIKDYVTDSMNYKLFTSKTTAGNSA